SRGVAFGATGLVRSGVAGGVVGARRDGVSGGELLARPLDDVLDGDDPDGVVRTQPRVLVAQADQPFEVLASCVAVHRDLLSRGRGDGLTVEITLVSGDPGAIGRRLIARAWTPQNVAPRARPGALCRSRLSRRSGGSRRTGPAARSAAPRARPARR